MLHSYKKLAAGLAIIATGLLSCNKFTEINSNPNTTGQVSASMLCTGAVLSVAKFNGRDAKAYIADNALAKYVGYANEGQLAEQYNLLGAGSFGALTILPNLDDLLEYAKLGTMESSYQGVAAFVRAYTFYQLTMQMGDIPCSDANKGKIGQYQAKFDTQKEVFLTILEDLKAADGYFADGTSFTGDPTPYNGDPVKWRAATNSFALKVLMTLSNKVDDPDLNIKARFKEIVDGGHLIETTADFFGLVYSAQNRHPISGTNDLFTSRTVLSSILVDNLKTLNDRRLFYYGDPAAARIGEGMTEDQMEAYYGVHVDTVYAAMNASHSAGRYSLINSRYLKEEASEPRMLLTYAEQQLILAEAAVLGWIPGSAATYYKEGVSSALEELMNTSPSYAHGMAIDQAYIDGYFTGDAAFKTTTTEQLKQIWMQRYLHQFMKDGLSSYFEYRRNKYPEFPINPATSLNANDVNAIPMRWLYPATETNYNRVILVEALDRQFDGYDEINKIMWLLK